MGRFFDLFMVHYSSPQLTSNPEVTLFKEIKYRHRDEKEFLKLLNTNLKNSEHTKILQLLEKYLKQKDGDISERILDFIRNYNLPTNLQIPQYLKLIKNLLNTNINLLNLHTNYNSGSGDLLKAKNDFFDDVTNY